MNFSIPSEALREYYIDKNYSQQQCADYFGVKRSTLQFYLKKYGISKDKNAVHECTKKTCLNRYGTDSVTKVPQFKEKIKQTTTKHYGPAGNLGRSEVREKIRKNNLQKYGVDHPMKCEKGRALYQNTMLNKYGVSNASQSLLFQDKKKKTCLKHYGVDNPSQSDVVKKIKIETNLKNFGVPCNLVLEDTKKQIRNTCLQKYGMPCPPIKKYSIDGYIFDSSWEAYLYIYARDHGEEIQRCPVHIPYTYKNKKHFTVPDFLYKGKLIEIKGDHFFENGTLISIYDRREDGLANAKYCAAIASGVEFWFQKDIQFAIDYCKRQYPNNFLEQYKQ